MADRIVDLEMQLTHQQRQVEELNELVYSQQLKIDLMATELRQIREQLQIVLPSLAKEEEDETPPPHY